MTTTTNLTTAELVKYCTDSHDAFVRKAGERLREMEAERDAAQTAVIEQSRINNIWRQRADRAEADLAHKDIEIDRLRAERDEARALLKRGRSIITGMFADAETTRWIAGTDAALKEEK